MSVSVRPYLSWRCGYHAGELDQHFAGDQKRPALSEQLAQEFPREAGRTVVGAHQNVHIKDKSQRTDR
jgi:hypothetical protein